MEARARLFTQLHKLAGLSPAERLRIIALIYLESGVDAAREAARLANIPATSVDRRGRWALVEGAEPVEELEEGVEERVEPLEEPTEIIEEEYVGKAALRRMAPWSWSS
ncbi:MAG: hypothetical protein RXR02_07160 [Thermoproteus sp.]|nr:MAG: hypothetical protein AT711_06220 [Thermoproteus sp. CIS_19]